jgi:hypothetical protein
MSQKAKSTCENCLRLEGENRQLREQVAGLGRALKMQGTIAAYFSGDAIFLERKLARRTAKSIALDEEAAHLKQQGVKVEIIAAKLGLSVDALRGRRKRAKRRTK